MTNYLYIGIGAKSHYYTLREIAQNIVGKQGTHDIYWQNLSQNADEAIEKASVIASELGLELRTSRKALADQLAEIQRASAEEIAERERKEQQQQAYYDAYKKERLDHQFSLVNANIYPYGKYKGLEFRSADIGYINWIISNENSENPVEAALAKAVKEVCADLILPTPNQNYAGEPKQRKQFAATVVRTGGYDSQFGYVNVVTLVTDAGECLVVKSTSFFKRVGTKLTFKATIKEHAVYNEQNQTIIQRVQEV